jgi:hypothetical protein
VKSPNENATRQGGALKTAYDGGNIRPASSNFKPELFPANVELLSKRRIPFTRRHGSRDLMLVCSFCGGKLILDESLPWYVCLGDLHCRVQATTFEKVVLALAEKARSK